MSEKMDSKTLMSGPDPDKDTQEIGRLKAAQRENRRDLRRKKTRSVTAKRRSAKEAK